MINIHLNGDLVRCPDMRAIKLRLIEKNLKQGRCKFGITEYKCPAWVQYCLEKPQIKQLSYFGRCYLSGCNLCPNHIKRIELGKMDKSFKIDNTVYRKLSSTAHYLVKESKTKTLFITLTFPQFKKKITYNEINIYFSKFMENLRKNYDCGGYIAVREFGKKTHRVHFHILLSIPFVPFIYLNNIWCNCISDICHYSRNALTTDKKTVFIRNPGRALKYVCKYFAKCRGESSKTRLVFMSNNIIQRPKQCNDSIESILKDYKGIFIQQTSDYTTSYRITNTKEFLRFCNNFLYPFFELSDKNEYLYSFPLNTS